MGGTGFDPRIEKGHWGKMVKMVVFAYTDFMVLIIVWFYRLTFEKGGWRVYMNCQYCFFSFFLSKIISKQGFKEAYLFYFIQHFWIFFFLFCFLFVFSFLLFFFFECFIVERISKFISTWYFCKKSYLPSF